MVPGVMGKCARNATLEKGYTLAPKWEGSTKAGCHRRIVRNSRPDWYCTAVTPLKGTLKYGQIGQIST